MVTTPFIETTSGLKPNAGQLGTPGAIVATSTSTQTISSGSLAFTIQAQCAFAPGMWVSITNASNANQWMWGVVQSYSGTNLVVIVTNTSGTGTISNWQIALAGSPLGFMGGSVPNSQLAAMPAHTVKANISGSSNTPTDASLTSVIDNDLGATQGDILYRDSSNWNVLAPGTAGFVLKTGGTAANPSWADPSASLDPIADATLLSNISGSSAVPIANTLTAIIDHDIGNVQGDILYRNATGWVVLAPGTSGNFLATQGAGSNPIWTTAAATLPGGTDTQVQYNASGAFAANSGLVYNYGTNTLTATNINTTTRYRNNGTAFLFSDSTNDNLIMGVSAFPTSNGSNTGNIAIGRSALGAAGGNVGCNTNIALGPLALQNATTAQANIAIGTQALSAAVSGIGNTAIGITALSSVNGGNHNTAFGYGTGTIISNGANNVVIGYQVASTTLQTGSNNVLIGTSSSIDTPLAATSNYLNINGWITGTGGNLTCSGTWAASNFSGTLTGTNTGDQTITLTGDVTGSGTGSFAATVAKIAGVTVGTPTGTGNVVMSASPTLTGTAIVAAITGSGTINTTGALQLNGHGAITQTVVQAFSATGTYTPTAGMVYCVIECQAPGGGGGGLVLSVTQSGGGGGGGGGGYARIVATAATIGASKAVTVGTGGAGGIGNNPGAAGSSNTSVGTICVATPGSGGGGNGGGVATGGAGGAGTTGTVQFTGGKGGTPAFASITTITCPGGNGGASFFCGDTPGPAVSSGGSTGVAAPSFGGGGSGASANASTTSQTGGAGAAGYVIITEFISA